MNGFLGTCDPAGMLGDSGQLGEVSASVKVLGKLLLKSKPSRAHLILQPEKTEKLLQVKQGIGPKP